MPVSLVNAEFRRSLVAARDLEIRPLFEKLDNLFMVVWILAMAQRRRLIFLQALLRARARNLRVSNVPRELLYLRHLGVYPLLLREFLLS